jgi:hypothetical protein
MHPILKWGDNVLQDYTETVAVVGRYISENYNGVALHPIDFIDTSSGKLLAEVMDPDITTISPVNKLHPQDDILATGSSRYTCRCISSQHHYPMLDPSSHN